MARKHRTCAKAVYAAYTPRRYMHVLYQARTCCMLQHVRTEHQLACK
jgi:hypothetical protein